MRPSANRTQARGGHLALDETIGIGDDHLQRSKPGELRLRTKREEIPPTDDAALGEADMVALSLASVRVCDWLKR